VYLIFSILICSVVCQTTGTIYFGQSNSVYTYAGSKRGAINYLTTPHTLHTRASNSGPPDPTYSGGGTLTTVEGANAVNRIVGPSRDDTTKKTVTLLNGDTLIIPYNYLLYIDAQAGKIKQIDPSVSGATPTTLEVLSSAVKNGMNNAASCAITAFYKQGNALYFVGGFYDYQWSLYRYDRDDGTLTEATTKIDCDYSDMHNMVAVQTINGEKVYIANGKQIRRYNYAADTFTTIFSQPQACSSLADKECYVYGVDHDDDSNKIYFSLGPEIKRANEDGTSVESVYSEIIDNGQFGKRLIIYAIQIDEKNNLLFVSGYPDGSYLSIRCMYRIPQNPTTMGNSISIAENDDRFIACYAGGSAQFALFAGDSLNSL